MNSWVLSTFEEQDSCLGTDEGCWHEHGGTAAGTPLLTRSCSGTSPCSAHAPEHGIPYGYIQDRLLRILT